MVGWQDATRVQNAIQFMRFIVQAVTARIVVFFDIFENVTARKRTDANFISSEK